MVEVKLEDDGRLAVVIVELVLNITTLLLELRTIEEEVKGLVFELEVLLTLVAEVTEEDEKDDVCVEDVLMDDVEITWLVECVDELRTVLLLVEETTALEETL